MGLSLRLLVLDRADRIYRLDVRRFDRMQHSPKMHLLPQFAGQRVRIAEAVVELINRKPARIVRMAFSILTFDRTGCLDTDVYERQQFGRFAGHMSQLDRFSKSAGTPTDVLDARHLFDDRGGRWAPSESLLHDMQEAALGNVNVPRL